MSVANNPFFIYDMDKICIVCNHKLIKHPIYSIFEELSKIEPKTSVIKALELVSNFQQMNIENGPQRICSTCYNNTIAALRFWRMCEKSIAHLEFYLEHQNVRDEKMSSDNSETSMDTLSQEIMTVTSEEVTVKTKVEPSDKSYIDGIDKAELENDYHIQVENNDNESIKINKGMLKNEKQASDPGAVRVPCKICQKLYRQDYMPKHMRVHTGERPYSCKSCERRFKGPTELKTHMTSVHSDSREFLCNTCGKSFKLQAHLQGHLKIHTDERPYECKVCGKKFRTTNTLKEHSSVHSDERPIACEICGKCFPGKKHLRQHMISHDEVKRHECHLCGNRFTQAHSLRTHLSRHCKGNR